MIDEVHNADVPFVNLHPPMRPNSTAVVKEYEDGDLGLDLCDSQNLITVIKDLASIGEDFSPDSGCMVFMQFGDKEPWSIGRARLEVETNEDGTKSAQIILHTRGKTC